MTGRLQPSSESLSKRSGRRKSGKRMRMTNFLKNQAISTSRSDFSARTFFRTRSQMRRFRLKKIIRPSSRNSRLRTRRGLKKRANGSKLRWSLGLKQRKKPCFRKCLVTISRWNSSCKRMKPNASQTHLCARRSARRKSMQNRTSMP